MTTHNRQYIKLDECINCYIDESEQSIHKYAKLHNIAFSAMTELGIDFFYKVKSVKLPVNANKTVTLPADYLNYVKVGVLNAKGELTPLWYNSNLVKYADLLPDRIDKVTDNGVWDISVFPNVLVNYAYGSYQNTYYGLASGTPNIGDFKIDNSQGVILLNINFGYDYIIIEYLASPSDSDDYYVPIQFKEAIIAYLRWKDIISLPQNRRSNLGEKAMRRHEYFEARRSAVARWKPFYLSEAHQANLEQTRMTIKS